MKKITLLAIGIGLLSAACASSQPKTTNSGCSVKGKDCWAIAQLLGNTKEITLDTREEQGENIWKNSVKYENPDLAALDLTVTQHIMYRDGGSTIYVLNDEVAFFTNRRLGSNPELGYTTVTFKENGQKFVFNTKGKVVNKIAFSKRFLVLKGIFLLC